MIPPSLTDPSPSLEPVASNGRIQALDVVRGVALIGIFLMNIEYFNRPLDLSRGLPTSLHGIAPGMSGAPDVEAVGPIVAGLSVISLGALRYRYGPMEWLWRAITYWTIPPMRREPISPLATLPA